MPEKNLAFTLVADEGDLAYQTQDLRAALEKGTDDLKLDTLRRIIVSTLNGQPQPALLMPIIQFVLPSKSKQIKKLLHLWDARNRSFYWEICPKYDENGKLKQEMILVWSVYLSFRRPPAPELTLESTRSNAIRNDLQHPNEYIRGATLRFIQKLREPELLEPLIPTCRLCLEHRHSYVRKNAVLAVFTIYKNFDYLIPDAPELIQTFMAAESDTTSLRNAFVMLQAVAPSRAVEYFLSIYEQIPNLDEMMQLAVIELIRKESKGSSGEGALKARYIKCIFELLNSGSHSVKYEAATTLTTLTQNPAAVKAAASCLISLVLQEPSNNVKTIVLTRISLLHQKHDHVLDELVMDILRVLASPDMDVRRKALAIAFEMVSSRNVEEVIGFLKKELLRTLDNTFEKATEYRQLLIQTIHSCAIKHSEVAASVVHVLMEFLGDASNASAVDVIAFVREVVEKFPALRRGIVDKLLQTFPEIKSGKVFRGAMWIVGEYAASEEEVREAMAMVRRVVGEVPILASEQVSRLFPCPILSATSTDGRSSSQRLLDQAEQEAAASSDHNPNGDASLTAKPVPTSTTRVLADGTYATETVFSAPPTAINANLEAVKAQAKPPLRALILGGDFYTATVLAATLTKLVMRYKELSGDAAAVNGLRAECMLIMTSIIRVGQSHFASVPIDEDAQERILTCLQSLAELDQPLRAPALEDVFLRDTQEAYTKMVQHEEKKALEKKKKDDKASAVQPDDLIAFRQFSKKSAGGDADEYEMDLTKATGAVEAAKDDFISKLQRVVQLTGFSDPVYAEAYVNVQGFDIFLDVLIVNQTPDTLQNLTCEFATLGDLKLVERPTSYTLGPQSFQSIKATIKVSSTETGVIFGNIFYDGGAATTDSQCVVLNDIHIDILDYITPGYCNEAQFRSMWSEFEWENKVNVSTSIDDLRTYLDHIMSSTNMACLTPDAALEGHCGFLSANLYARSLFGEDALANLSIEKLADGTLAGHVRIRSKTQGIALSLGDRITVSQKAAAGTAA
ncbi:SPOSA6832_03989 [Sporobolomyces salmonicolor]|uniref:Coatomer subunit beta n=1 Tax=Sporidiobolus salmonicolor TaxID=5005 RepID=A0A0D6ERN6_SPOSA|nr:SPOSA6832_03989 [Sporobolomyces salmonicolor]